MTGTEYCTQTGVPCCKPGFHLGIADIFIVNKDGGIVEPEVIKGVNPSLDKEALRVISGMPKWKPGSQRGKPVRVKYTVPVNFRLDAGYSYVDLGLSVKWATYNVGANYSTTAHGLGQL